MCRAEQFSGGGGGLGISPTAEGWTASAPRDSELDLPLQND